MIEVSDRHFREGLAKRCHTFLPPLFPDHRESFDVGEVFDAKLDILDISRSAGMFYIFDDKRTAPMEARRPPWTSARPPRRLQPYPRPRTTVLARRGALAEHSAREYRSAAAEVRSRGVAHDRNFGIGSGVIG